MAAEVSDVGASDAPDDDEGAEADDDDDEAISLAATVSSIISTWSPGRLSSVEQDGFVDFSSRFIRHWPTIRCISLILLSKKVILIFE